MHRETSSLALVKLLLDRGAYIDARNWDQATPLYVASVEGNYDVAEILLKQGADVNGRNKWSWSPLHVAAKEVYNHVRLVRLLLDRSADVNALHRMHWNPLHLAAFNGRNEISHLLLERGADVQTTNARQRSSSLRRVHGATVKRNRFWRIRDREVTTMELVETETFDDFFCNVD